MLARGKQSKGGGSGGEWYRKRGNKNVDVLSGRGGLPTQPDQ